MATVFFSHLHLDYCGWDDCLQPLFLHCSSTVQKACWNCIHFLSDYKLPQCESIPDLSSKLSPTSLLVECIARTLVKLDPVKKKEILEYLAWEHLKTHGDHVMYLELFFKYDSEQYTWSLQYTAPHWWSEACKSSTWCLVPPERLPWEAWPWRHRVL